MTAFENGPNPRELSSTGLDALREIANIGAGHAATALSQLLDRTIEMNVPHVRLVDFTEIPNITGRPDSLFVGCMIDFSGDFSGYILFVLDAETARTMVSVLFAKSMQPFGGGDPTEFGELEISAFSEITNILAGSYLSAVSTMTKLQAFPSTPSVCIDMIGAMLSVVAADFSQVGDQVISIETRFMTDMQNPEGSLFLIPDAPSYTKLMEILGVNA